ncbi:MAG: tyrosine-type recombinase/integrase [Candidatus Aquicultor sp.]
MAKGTVVVRANGKNLSKDSKDRKGVIYAVYEEPREDDEKRKQKWERLGRNDVKKGHPEYFTISMAEAYLNEQLNNINQGTYTSMPDVGFKDFCNDFLKAHASRVKPSTLTVYQIHANNKLIPFFGNRKLKSIKPLDIERLLTSLLDEGKTPINTKKYLVTLKLILKRACELGYLVKSPAEYIKPPRTTKTEMAYLSPSELRLLIKNTDERYRALIMFAAFTGARQGEILGLQWDDIDFNSSYVYIHPNEIRDLKSAAANRKIPMAAELKEALQAHQLKQMVDLKSNPKNLVFTNTAGNSINPSNLDKRVLKPALTLARLRSIRFHDLRHSFATALLTNGEPLRYVSKLLGHADAAITLRTYTHVLPETEHNAHERFSTIFTPTKPLVLDRC